MRRRRREKRRGIDPEGPAHDRGNVRREEQYVGLLRRIQLGAGAVMLAGLTTATLVCAGEFSQPWLVAGGGAVFLLGILGYFAAPPLARRWSHKS